MNWEELIKPIKETEDYITLLKKVNEEYENHKCFPPKEQIYRALELTSFEQVKVVILGQDPYHNDFQANGLSFSVSNQVKTPPSLKNIFKELENDLGIIKKTNELEDWAEQGVLMLNATLTVRAHQANSHKNLNWSFFTDFIIKELSNKKEQLVFVLWGGFAQKKKKLIDTSKHFVIESVHPSPLSSYRGFFGSKPFSSINSFLQSVDKQKILW